MDNYYEPFEWNLQACKSNHKIIESTDLVDSLKKQYLLKLQGKKNDINPIIQKILFF
jgi:hypothetical protein